MNAGDLLRVFMVITGLVMLWATISSLAKRKMTETVCLVWGTIAVIFILAGILLHPYGISAYISKLGLVLIIVIAIAVLQGAFFVSTKISELARKNHELAVQISLLNHENYNMLKRMEQLEEQLEKQKEE
ncbi:MAG: DUF2304 family protein [Lachnospiraceae bacterium]|nr:DUF2304 family protein [Lachnospiraceae bacterium]